MFRKEELKEAIEKKKEELLKSNMTEKEMEKKLKYFKGDLELGVYDTRNYKAKMEKRFHNMIESILFNKDMIFDEKKKRYEIPEKKAKLFKIALLMEQDPVYKKEVNRVRRKKEKLEEFIQEKQLSEDQGDYYLKLAELVDDMNQYSQLEDKEHEEFDRFVNFIEDKLKSEFSDRETLVEELYYLECATGYHTKRIQNEFYKDVTGLLKDLFDLSKDNLSPASLIDFTEEVTEEIMTFLEDLYDKHGKKFDQQLYEKIDKCESGEQEPGEPFDYLDDEEELKKFRDRFDAKKKLKEEKDKAFKATDILFKEGMKKKE